MEKLNIYILDKTNAGPFSPYLLPPVRKLIGDGFDGLALGAATDQYAVGAVAGAVIDGTLHLASLYVAPQVRRQGIGTLLLRALGQLVRERGLEVHDVKAYYLEEEEDTAAIAAFLRSAGFGELRLNNRLFSMDTSMGHNIPGVKEAFSPSFQADPHVRPYSEITPEQLAEIEADESVLPCLKPSGIYFDLLRRGSVIWVEDGHVLGWIFVYQSIDGEIVMAASAKRAGAPKGCWHKLLPAVLNNCYLMLGRDYKIYALSINAHSASLAETIPCGTQRELNNYVTDTGDTLPVWLTGEEDAE